MRGTRAENSVLGLGPAALSYLKAATLAVPCVDFDHRFSVRKLFDHGVKSVTKQCEQCLIGDIAGGNDQHGRRRRQRQKVGVLGDDHRTALDRIPHDRRVRFCRRERYRDMLSRMALSRDPARQSRRQLRVDQKAH